MNSPIRLTWVRVMYAANIVGTGITESLVTFFAPVAAGFAYAVPFRYLFARWETVGSHVA